MEMHAARRATDAVRTATGGRYTRGSRRDHCASRVGVQFQQEADVCDLQVSRWCVRVSAAVDGLTRLLTPLTMQLHNAQHAIRKRSDSTALQGS